LNRRSLACAVGDSEAISSDGGAHQVAHGLNRNDAAAENEIRGAPLRAVGGGELPRPARWSRADR